MGLKLGINSVIAICCFGSPAASQGQQPKLDVDWVAMKAESEARKAAADARKAEADASAAAAKAQFGDLANVTTAGTTTAGDKAGHIEAAILSMATTRTISTHIISDLCTRAPELCGAVESRAPIQPAAVGSGTSACAKLAYRHSTGAIKLYVVTEAEKPTFDTAEGVQAALCGIQRKFDKALSDSNRLQNGPTATVIAPAAIFTMANIVGNLFRSDYAVQGVVITPDDALLAKSIAAAAINRVTVPIILPSMYRPAALSTDNPLVGLIGQMDESRTLAVQLARGHSATSATLKKKGPIYAKQAEAHAAIAAQLEAAVKSYDDYLGKIATPSDKGTSELAEAARQMRMYSDLAAGSYLLSVKMNASGGSSYTKKNFWTFLGGVPFYVSGGTTASYTLIDGRSGAVIGAGAFGAAGGFNNIGKIHRSREVQ